MKKTVCLLLCLFLLCLAGCAQRDIAESSNINSSQSTDTSSVQEGNGAASQSSSKISSSAAVSAATSSVVSTAGESADKKPLSLEDKVSRLFIVKPEALNLDPASGKHIPATITQINSNIKTALKKYKVGGVILFDANIVSATQLNTLTSQLKKASSLPFFMSVDEEGGQVSRVMNKLNYSNNPGSALYLATPEKVKKAYADIAAVISSHGFNLNFAPVADIYTNPKNTVIGSRALGKDPETVSKLLVAALEGHKAVPHCVKHFPGHGDTSEDTHDGSVTISKNWEELLKCEIIPFKTAVENDCDMIMTSHIILPNVTNEDIPASLSYEITTGKLRKELGFNGVIITDSLAMGAITKHYSSGAAAVKAIKAGADLLLCPQNFVEAYNAVLQAVKNGEISEEQIDESVKRIDTLFKKYNIS